jgi:hypothetical protein
LSTANGSLTDSDQKLLKLHLSNPEINTHVQKLKENYFIRYASSSDISRLRNHYKVLDNFLNGTRETPATISALARNVKILPRGNWMDESGEVVQPAFPHFLNFTQQESTEQRRLNRLDLAKWIVHRDNPLAARTYVNRVWAMFFGTALSSDPGDLGLQGEYPIYPELLDYLAYEFMASGWDVKNLVKLILMSETYQQNSHSNPELDVLDPYNRLLSRQSPRRLPAELVRDNSLAIADLLVNRVGGASVMPHQPHGYYDGLTKGYGPEYKPNNDEHQFRRGIYSHWQRTFLHPMLKVFDAPGRDECSASRPKSITPLQALNLLNDPSSVEAAISLAKVLVNEHPGDDSSRLNYAYLRALARKPKKDEVSNLLVFLAHERQRFGANPESAQQLLNSYSLKNDASAPKIELASWTSVSRAILNLHETITRY